MEPQIIVLGRKSPWPIVLGSAFSIIAAVAFSVWSFQSGFDVSERPWAARQLWAWYAVAYAGPPLVIGVALSLVSALISRRFVAIAVRDDKLEVVNLSVRRMDLANLIALEIGPGLTFISRTGVRLETGSLGLIGGWRSVARKLRKISPRVELRRAPSRSF